MIKQKEKPVSKVLKYIFEKLDDQKFKCTDEFNLRAYQAWKRGDDVPKFFNFVKLCEIANIDLGEFEVLKALSLPIDINSKAFEIIFEKATKQHGSVYNAIKAGKFDRNIYIFTKNKTVASTQKVLAHASNCTVELGELNKFLV